MARARASSPSESFRLHWFVLGVVLLAASLVAFFWAFSVDFISPSRKFLLLWILPLSSGFSCGCFAGSIRASPKGSLAVVATGGFAVWLLTLLFLQRIPTETASPAIATAKVSNVTNQDSLITSKCEAGFQAYQNRCVSQRMSDYIACVQSAGGNSQVLIKLMTSDTKALDSKKINESGIKLDESQLISKVESVFFPGAMSECAKAMLQNDDSVSQKKNSALESLIFRAEKGAEVPPAGEEGASGPIFYVTVSNPTEVNLTNITIEVLPGDQVDPIPFWVNSAYDTLASKCTFERENGPIKLANIRCDYIGKGGNIRFGLRTFAPANGYPFGKISVTTPESRRIFAYGKRPPVQAYFQLLPK